jgi:hypothetical protein
MRFDIPMAVTIKITVCWDSMLGGSPCHYRVVRPRDTDGRDSLRQWRLAANILNKQPRTNDKWWSSSLGLTTPHRKSKLVTKCINEPQTWTDSLDNRLKRRNMDMRFGTWDIGSLYRVGTLMTVSRELSRYRFDLVGVQVTWEGSGTSPAGEYTYFCGKGNENHELRRGILCI